MMRDEAALQSTLESIDGLGYRAYRELKGAWDLGAFVLRVDHVQGDPFAHPSRMRVLLPPRVAGLPAGAFRSQPRAIGTACYLARRFAEDARKGNGRGDSTSTGRSGEIAMADPGQVVLPQTAVQVSQDGAIEARFTGGLPARGRRIDATAAAHLLLERVPALVSRHLLAGAHDEAAVEEAAALNEDAEALRGALALHDLVAFTADGAILPRRSGVDDRPMPAQQAVCFRAPESLRKTIRVPNRGAVSGMGIPTGITLIVGGGFHGKSTLLRALQRGVYNHAPGDGREWVVSREDAVKVRAEDGRSVAGVDISSFIGDLPGGQDTRSFTTEEASGSTSQAAGIAEALEADARLLLVDEDTSATNFMIRDRRMQELVPSEGEPITPFVDRVATLRDECDISTVLVLGGSGDYLDVADTVVRMDGYLPFDVTVAAHDTASKHPTGRRNQARAPFHTPTSRQLELGSIDPARGRRSVHVKVPDTRTLLFGQETIDLAGLEQLAGKTQIRAIGQALAWVAREAREPDVGTLLDRVEEALHDGLDTFDERRVGDLTAFRRFELAAVLNRLRSLRVVKSPLIVFPPGRGV